MSKAILAGAVVMAAASAAFAVDTPLPTGNGSFESPNASGFTQTITNWTVSFTGTVPAQFQNPNQYSGLFTSFGTKLTAGSVPNGSAFALIDNLGTGSVSLTSGASGVNFQVVDRNIAFRYAYLTNDAPGTGNRDVFHVRVDFFNTATATVSNGNFIDQIVATQGKFNDSGTGISPFGGSNNNATFTYNDAGAGGAGVFNLVNIDVSQFFGSFARISFIVDNGGPSPGTNGNGLGVSGAAIDNVVLNPEPSAVGLFALGLAGLGGFAWRRRATVKKPAA